MFVCFKITANVINWVQNIQFINSLITGYIIFSVCPLSSAWWIPLNMVHNYCTQLHDTDFWVVKFVPIYVLYPCLAILLCCIYLISIFSWDHIRMYCIIFLIDFAECGLWLWNTNNIKSIKQNT